MTKLWIGIALLTATIGYFFWCNMHSVAGGVKKGRLQSCPSSPNCVCSCDEERSSSIAPFPAKEGGLEKVKEIVQRYPRTTIVEETEEYLHAEFRSQWIGFVDDVEFLLDKENGVIQVRSASRVGYGDMGVNRNRIEELRKLYLKKAL